MQSTGSVSTKIAEASATEARSDRVGELSDRALWVARPGPWPTFARFPDCLPGLAVAARSGFLVLVIVLLVGLCAIVVCWKSRRPAHPAENDLLAGLSSSNLNNTSAEALPAFKEPAPPAEPDSHLTPVSLVEPPGLFDSGNYIPSGPVVDPAFLRQLLVLQDPHRGDSPMIHRWKLLGMPTFLALVLAAPVPFDSRLVAAEPGSDHPATEDKSSKILDQLADLQKSLNEFKITMNRDVADIKLDISKFRRDVDAMHVEIKGIQDDLLREKVNVVKIQSDVEDLKKQPGSPDLESLKKEITQLQKDLDDLRKRSTSSTVSSYPALPPGTGRVRLVNTYFQPITIIINSKSYELEPGETRLTDPFPVGTFTYEVLGVTTQRTRTLAANDTFTIDVHPVS